MRLKGISTTKASPLLRTSIKIRTIAEERDERPGAIEADTVAHCGPTFVGEFARTLTLTDMVTGWTENASIRNNASRWITQAVEDLQTSFPFPLVSFDSDNGSEFINHDVVGWAANRKIFFTRARPYKKNDQATIESKNGHLVRRYGFYWRYDTPEELTLLNQLWPLVNDRLNYFTPTKKPVGWDTDTAGRRRRVYDTPATPVDRLLAAGVLSPAQEAELRTRRERLNPADLARRILTIQDRLTGLARDKTLNLQASSDKPMADTGRGVRLRHAS